MAGGRPGIPRPEFQKCARNRDRRTRPGRSDRARVSPACARERCGHRRDRQSLGGGDDGRVSPAGDARWITDASPRARRPRPDTVIHTFLRTSASCRRASNMACMCEKFEFVTGPSRPVRTTYCINTYRLRRDTHHGMREGVGSSCTADPSDAVPASGRVAGGHGDSGILRDSAEPGVFRRAGRPLRRVGALDRHHHKAGRLAFAPPGRRRAGLGRPAFRSAVSTMSVIVLVVVGVRDPSVGFLSLPSLCTKAITKAITESTTESIAESTTEPITTPIRHHRQPSSCPTWSRR